VDTKEIFTNYTCVEQMRIANREFASFIGAVTELYGPEQARLSADDWLDEAELMNIATRSARRAWRSVTIAAAARLANRLAVVQRHELSLVASSDSKVSPIPSSNCISSALLV
jgi:hypothetical protein